MPRRLGLVLSALALVLVSASPASAVSPGASLAATAPHMSLSSSSGPPTSTVTIAGSGFGAHEVMDVYFDTTDERVAVTGDGGGFGITVGVPASAVPGTHWITAVRRHSGLAAQTAFTVRANWSQFHYSVKRRGWNPYENVLNPGNVANVVQAWSYPTGSDSVITTLDSSPAVANGVLYVGSGNDDVYALNAATGAKLWSYTTGAGVFSSPAVVNGVVYVGSFDGNVYALDAATGAKLWSYTTGNAIFSSPAVANGVVYVGSQDDNVYALNAATGARLWTDTTGGPLSSSQVVVNGVIYVGSFNGGVYTLYAFSLPGRPGPAARPRPGNLQRT